MSIINKILSKKIHFHVSLRGLFPFCHSRESGNPSSLSLRGTKQRSNLNGFTLIELMVAVVILSIALIGIFLAFSNAWMGMADGRDRTVATNYAREAMEDVKNMDFELVTNENLGTAESVGAKFTRVIIVNTENDNLNLKKIDTKVFWTNTRDQYVSVETSMYMNRTILNPGEAAKLMLYADPYYTVLPTAGTANIIAVIKDINGNTKIDWTGGNIRFLITDGSECGFLPGGAYTPGVEPTKGRADITFTGSEEGNVVIEASVDLPSGGTISATITIRVTLDVVRIELSADPTSIEADGISISTVTAALKNSGDVTVTTATNDITFNISGEGIFVDSLSEGSPLPDTIIMAPSEGTATIYVRSINDTPGVATVTASSEGLLSDTINIITTGVATSISVSVEPDLIYIGDTDGVRVTVEIQDINGNPVEYTDTINLSISGGTGIFEDNPVGPGTIPIAYSTLFHPTSSGTITITASGGTLADGSATIDVGEVLIADTITIKAEPKNILADGGKNSIITATIKDGSIVISNYSNEITFKIISDTSTYQDAKLSFNSGTWGIGELLTVTGEQYGSDGEAVIDLKPASDVGICTIEVTTVNSLGTTIMETIKVGFYASEDHIELKAFPSKMLVEGDTCTVTAIVVDEGGNQVYTYEEDITFTILVGWPKIAKFALTGTSSLTTTLTNGDIDIDLIPQKEAGTVTLKASSFTGMTDITGYLNIPVITALTDLELALEPHISYVGNQVSFDINVQGADLFLVEMQVSWSPDVLETLYKIEINPNSTGDIVIYQEPSPPILSGEPINVNDITLLAGISNVKLYFNESMSGKTLEVIFNPNSGNYPVEINVPLT